MNERWTNVINVYEAMRLKRKGLSWRQIGKILAKNEGRPNAYQPMSVYAAVYKARKCA